MANPDLPIDFVAQLLIAKELPDEPFTFEENWCSHQQYNIIKQKQPFVRTYKKLAATKKKLVNEAILTNFNYW